MISTKRIWRCKDVDENKIIRGVAIAGGALFVLAVCWFLLGEPDVHDQRERADDVRTELGNAGSAQRDAQRHIDDAGRGIDRSLESADAVAGRIDEAAERIADVQEQSDAIAGILEDSERRIEESKRIIQAVRVRAGQN